MEEDNRDSNPFILEIEDVTKCFGDFKALKNVSVKVRPRECLVICGPSGSGKSTLARCVNRIEREIQGGDIKFKGRSIFQMKIAEVRKNIGMVFQQFNLFYHMSVEQNIMLAPIQVSKLSVKEAREKAHTLLERVGLADKASAFPIELSGGQKQRVAICRCLAMDPDLILFDEPTSALDPEMIKEVLDIMKALAHSGTTMVCVTHELGFAKEVANHIVFMEDGMVVEESRTTEFFERPKSMRTRRFIEQILKA